MIRDLPRQAAAAVPGSAAALPLLFLAFSLVWWSHIPLHGTVAIASLFALSLLRPATALLIVAAAAPVALVLFSGWQWPLRWAEALVVTFLAGAMLQVSARRRLRWDSIGVAAGLLAAVILASAAVELTVLQPSIDYPRLFLLRLWHFVSREYFADSQSFPALTGAALLLECLALFVVTRTLTLADGSRAARIIRMCLLGGFAAAGLNLARLAGAWLRTPDGGVENMWRLLLTQRVNEPHGDLNAAGSYYAMLIPVLAGIAFSSRRPARAWSLPVAFALIGGLWLAGSRTALAACGVAMIAFLAGTYRIHRNDVRVRRAVAGTLAVALTATVLAIALYPRSRNVNAGTAMDVRTDMARAAIRMFATRPLFGVGAGTFYLRSGEYIPPWLKKFYTQENAHNNFLQLLAELGIAGFSLGAFLVVAALRTAAAGRSQFPMTALGLLCGLGAFLLTCLGGHPLLTPEVAFPFWILLGVASALPAEAAEITAPSRRRALRWWVAAALVLLAVSVPLRASRNLREADFANRSVGFSPWARSPDGVPFRWARQRSYFFVPADAIRVRFRLRLGPGRGSPRGVTVRLDDRLANRVDVTTEQWTVVEMTMPPPGTAGYRRIELEVEGTDAGGRAEEGAGLMVEEFSESGAAIADPVKDDLLPLEEAVPQHGPRAPPASRIERVGRGAAHDDRRFGPAEAAGEDESRASRVIRGRHDNQPAGAGAGSPAVHRLRFGEGGFHHARQDRDGTRAHAQFRQVAHPLVDLERDAHATATQQRHSLARGLGHQQHLRRPAGPEQIRRGHLALRNAAGEDDDGVGLREGVFMN